MSAFPMQQSLATRREFLRVIALSGIGIGMIGHSSEAKSVSPARKKYNAWVVIILVEAHMACRKRDREGASKYLARAKAVMANYLVKGWDDSGHPGGMRWGYDPSKANTSDRGTSSTAGSALAALMLARA